MKKIILLTLLSFFGFSQAQNLAQGFNQMTPEKRKEIINMMVDELDIPENSEQEFRKLYSEYLDQQKEIKSRFIRTDDYNSISDEEAKQRINQSFEVGQQLLNNRKEYAGKFMKICKPQQVLKMYQTEGMIRDKMMDRKSERSQNTNRKR